MQIESLTKVGGEWRPLDYPIAEALGVPARSDPALYRRGYFYWVHAHAEEPGAAGGGGRGDEGEDHARQDQRLCRGFFVLILILGYLLLLLTLIVVVLLL